MLKRIMKQRELIGLYKKVFRSEDGAKVLNDIMELCGIGRTSYDPDSKMMAFNEGQRAVALRIIKTLNITEKELERWFKQRENELIESEEQL